ncbi:unnamed protein product [Calypogeia fissa]
MVVEKDVQPGVRMQMVWKQQQKKKTRPPLNAKSLPFQLSDDEDNHEDDAITVRSGASSDAVVDEHRAVGVEGGQQPGETSGRQSENLGARKSRDELEHLQQSERLLNEGNSLAEEGRLGEALGKWEAAIHLTPRKAILHEQKAQVLLEIGRSWSAVQAATSATELQPTWAEAWVTLARAQLNYGEPYLAVESAQTALRLEPDNKEANTEYERAQFLAIRQRQAVRQSTADNLDAEGLESNGHSSLPSTRRAKVYDTHDISFGVEHQQTAVTEPETDKTEDDNFDKYDDDNYDWVDDLKRPPPERTTENLMSDFSDIL